MKVKKRKKDNKLKYIIAILLVVSALCGALFWNHQQNKYVASTKTSEKKAGDAFSTLGYKIGRTHGTDIQCQDTIDNMQVRVINDAIMEELGVESEDQIVNAINEKNLHYIINCVPKSGSFSKAQAGNTFTFAMYDGVKDQNNTSPVYFNCAKGSKVPDVSQKKFDRLNTNIKKITIYNAHAFTIRNTHIVCPAKSVYITYNLNKVASGTANDQINGEQTSATVTDDDGETNTIELEGNYSIEDDDETENISENDSGDAAGSAESQNIIIQNSNDAKISKQEVVVHIPGFDTFKEEYDNAPSNKKQFFNVEGKTLTESQVAGLSLTCNYKLDRSDVVAIEKQNKRSLIDKDGNITEYYYDNDNTHYYKATRVEKTDIKVNYYYHSIPKTGQVNYRTEEGNIKCTKTCTEIVKVQYGPPVEVAGGMCFEYRVKVTSIVKCKVTDIEVDKPKKQSRYCKLKPTCAHGIRQGGPNDDFEMCIQLCDGGSYSEKCSNKCYNEVYGGKLALTTVEKEFFGSGTAPQNFYYTDSSGNPLNTSGKIRGQYYYDTDRQRFEWCPSYKSGLVKITNNGGASTNNSTKMAGQKGYLGLWYYIQKYKTHWYNDEYESDKYGRGFIRAKYDNGEQCTDSCGWYVTNSNCTTNSYFGFNYNVSNKRKKDNSIRAASNRCPRMYVYNYVKQGKKYVEPSDPSQRKYVEKRVCTTKQLILYDYLNNKKRYKEAIQDRCNSKVTCTTTTAEFNIRFKYQNSETKEIVSINYPYDVQKFNEGTNTFTYKSETLTSSDDSNHRDWQESREAILRFGGCYRNSKNYNWYHSEWTFPGTWMTTKRHQAAYGDKPAGSYSLDRGSVCLPTSAVDTNEKWAEYFNEIKLNPNLEVDPNKWEFSQKDYETNTQNGYNIQATTNRFGFFHWRFKISCFYALDATSDTCLDPPCKTTESELRSIDTSDPFLQNMTSGTKNVGEAEKKRDVGFNWTSDATLTDFTKDGYDQDPAKLTEHIMSTDTFSEANLDYEVVLHPEQLKYIREENRDKRTYNTLFNDTMTAEQYYSEGNGVPHYKSPLLDSYFHLTVLKCNNKSCTVKGGQ